MRRVWYTARPLVLGIGSAWFVLFTIWRGGWYALAVWLLGMCACAALVLCYLVLTKDLVPWLKRRWKDSAEIYGAGRK